MHEWKNYNYLRETTFSTNQPHKLFSTLSHYIFNSSKKDEEFNKKYPEILSAKDYLGVNNIPETSDRTEQKIPVWARSEWQHVKGLFLFLNFFINLN